MRWTGWSQASRGSAISTRTGAPSWGSIPDTCSRSPSNLGFHVTLESDPGSYLVPAHIWTPWFAALGSRSGFDAIDNCYGDLAPHIFAVETGLPSDPPMNWRVSSLDRFRLVSNSDAHSPEELGREVCVFDTELDYFALCRALETGAGYGGTLEFFPELRTPFDYGEYYCEVVVSKRNVDQVCFHDSGVCSGSPRAS